MIIKRILGLLIVITALLGLAACIVVVFFGQPAFDVVTNDIDNSLTTLNTTLDTVSETLQLAQVTTSQVITGLTTAESSVLDTARSISETRPLVKGTGQILTVDLANSIDSVQATIPTLAKLAASVDQSLSFLSKAQILGFRLGIDYNPSVPLDQSITAIGRSFNGIPEKLRGMTGDLDTSDRNLVTMSTNLSSIGSNLHAINASFARFTDLFSTYQTTTETAKQRLQATQAELRSGFQVAKTSLVIFFVWLALAQLAPLYIGIVLLTKPKAA